MASILIVEDNENLRQLMRIHLDRAGHTVFEASDGQAALAVLDKAAIHLIIADIMMPRLDGYQLTDLLRGAKIETPILLVTARETLADMRMGFRKGADDYMIKPINMEEMLLRVDALLRRADIRGSHILHIAGLVISQDSLTVARGDEITVLPQKEFFLLQMLLSYPGRIFTRQTLMDEIWGYDSDTDPRTVDVHIRRLRERFADFTSFTIETVRGLGYKAVIQP